MEVTRGQLLEAIWQHIKELLPEYTFATGKLVMYIGKDRDILCRFGLSDGRLWLAEGRRPCVDATWYFDLCDPNCFTQFADTFRTYIQK